MPTRSLAKWPLRIHPDQPSKIQSVSAELLLRADGIRLLEFVAHDPEQMLSIPEQGPSGRADNLWRHTCFEIFVAKDAQRYREFNFSPSTAWAAYDFMSYRDDRKDAAIGTPPQITSVRTRSAYAQLVALDARDLASGVAAISAVIEAKDGTKSYWALAHAPGPPDFHNPDCFIATLPAPDAS